MPHIGKQPGLEYARALFGVIEALSAKNREMGVTELSNELCWSTSKIFRIVHTLYLLGYLKKNPSTRKYRLGVKFWDLGCASISGLGVKEVAHPFLEFFSIASRILWWLGDREPIGH